MQDRKMQIIQQLMEELQEQMKYDKGDFSERLGRPKPEVQVVKMEGEIPMDDEMKGDMPEDEMSDSAEGMMMEDESPEDKLKKRLMKLRA